jgi:hypothetical protein
VKTKAEYRNKMAGLACVLCGEYMGKRYGQSVLYDHNGEEVGLLCIECIDAGPEGAAERAHRRAVELRERAHKVDYLAQEITKCTEWVALAEVEAIDADIEEERLSIASSFG